MTAMDPTDPKYAPAAIVARQNTVVGVTIAMTLVGSLAVGFRVFTRSYIVGTLWAEDWAMIAAMFFAFGYALEVLIAVRSFNLGFSGADLSQSDTIGIIKITMAVVITYKLVLTLTKVSLLCFYLRIAVRPSFEKLSKCTLVLVILFQVILTFGTIGQCVPFEKNWDLTGQVKGKCIDANTFFHSASIFHIITDVWILILPVKLVFSIPRPLKERIALYGVFGLGFITVIAAIFRFQFLHAFTVSKDPFFATLPIHIWSMVEVHVGILCASLPTLRPLFSAAQRKRTKALQAPLSDTKEKVLDPKGTIGTLATSGTIAIGIGTTIRASIWRPPVPPKSPSYTSSPRSSPTYRRDPPAPAYTYNNKLSPVFDNSPPPTYGNRTFETDLERNISISNRTGPRKLAILKRDENGIFRPEAAYSPT